MGSRGGEDGLGLLPPGEFDSRRKIFVDINKSIRVNGLDWPMAAKRDLEGLRTYHAGNSQTAAVLSRIISSYVAALSDESKVPAVNQAMERAPQDLALVIPNVKGVPEAKQDLDNALHAAVMVLGRK